MADQKADPKTKQLDKLVCAMWSLLETDFVYDDYSVGNSAVLAAHEDLMRVITRLGQEIIRAKRVEPPQVSAPAYENVEMS